MNTNYISVYQRISVEAQKVSEAQNLWHKAVEHGTNMCEKRGESPYSKDDKPSKRLAIFAVKEFLYTLNIRLAVGSSQTASPLGELYRSILSWIESSRRADRIRMAKVRAKIAKTSKSSRRPARAAPQA